MCLSYARDIQPIYQTYCDGCHTTRIGQGGTNFALNYAETFDMVRFYGPCMGLTIAECSVQRMTDSTMPPPSDDDPVDMNDTSLVNQWIQQGQLP